MAGMSRLMGSGKQDPSDLNVDRISCLPWDVLDNIFGRLTIVDAVRTSVLAKDWRYKWLSHTEFFLNSVEVAFILNREDLRWDVVASVINRYLLHHTSAIRSFSLIASCDEHHPDVYQWIQYLSKQDVETLLFQETGSSYYRFKMPSHLFSFEKLKSLSLTTCALRIPPTFERFKWLYHIFFRDVSICDADLSRLILSCPLLKYLTLLHISGLKHLRIHAPKLSWLLIDTVYEDIVIEAAPILSTVRIAPSFRRPGAEPILKLLSVIHCLSAIGSLNSLALSGEFIKLLIADFGLKKIPLRNDAVTNLDLHSLRFENIDVFGVCLSLLRSCRNTKCFCFYIETAKNATKLIRKFFKKNYGQFSFPELEKVTVICDSNAGLGSAANLIEFIICHSPKLRFLTIYKEGMNNRQITNMFSRFRMNCPHARFRLTVSGRHQTS
ncbi:hypothetical protein RDABS01_014173 [Bienertia sinuspersici]